MRFVFFIVPNISVIPMAQYYNINSLKTNNGKINTNDKIFFYDELIL